MLVRSRDTEGEKKKILREHSILSDLLEFVFIFQNG